MLFRLEKAMATHSSTLAWKIPGMVEPGGLPSMGLHRVERDWRDLAAAAACCSGRGWSLHTYYFLPSFQGLAREAHS